MDAYQVAVLGFAAAASSVIANGVALGSGVFLLPVLALVFPPKIALGLGAPIVLASNIIGIRNFWGEWDDPRQVLVLVLSGGTGIALGAHFISLIPSDIFKIGIGVLSISFSLYQLIMDSSIGKRQGPASSAPRGMSSLNSKILSVVLGFLGGLASVFAHAGGIVWSMYYVGKKLDKRCLVSTLLLLFLSTNLLKTFTFLQVGLLSTDSLLIVLSLFPIIVLSGYLGNYLNKRVQPALFRKIVLFIIMVIGISLILT